MMACISGAASLQLWPVFSVLVCGHTACLQEQPTGMSLMLRSSSAAERCALTGVV